MSAKQGVGTVSRCTDPEVGNMLHAYELNQLDDDQRQTFEQHLMLCDHCFREVEAFAGVARLLRSDEELAEMIARADQPVSAKSKFRRILDALWPSAKPLLLRPLVAYVALALLIYPAYIGLRTGRTRDFQSAQTLFMNGTRGISQSDASANRPLTIAFHIESGVNQDTLVLAIVDSFGNIRYSDSSYTELSRSHMGSISLAARALPAGEYTLKVSALSDSLVAAYRFELH